jgi:acetyl esterase/lipase
MNTGKRLLLGAFVALLVFQVEAIAKVNGMTQIEEHDEVWIRHSDQDFQARIYTPQSPAELLPVILDIHGGAWNIGDRSNGVLYDQALARAGFVVVAIDFRDGPEFQHPAASDDVMSAIAWLQDQHERLHIDVDRIGLIGSSSGGHLALLAGVRSVDVRYVIALWPVSDPYYRYRYAKRAGLDRLVAAHDNYWVSEEAMREAGVARIVVAGEAVNLPPVLVVQPGEDSNVPIEMTFELIRAWQARRGYIEYVHFPDQPHAFGHTASAATSRMLDLVTDFAKRAAATHGTSRQKSENE